MFIYRGQHIFDFEEVLYGQFLIYFIKSTMEIFEKVFVNLVHTNVFGENFKLLEHHHLRSDKEITS